MNAKIIVKESNCYKNLSNPSCTDLRITYSSSSYSKYQDNINGFIEFSQNGYNYFKTVLKQRL